MKAWPDGFEVLATHPGGSWLPHGTGPGEALWAHTSHSTEGFSRNPRGAAGAHKTPPHTWVTLPSHPYAPRVKLALVPITRSALALRHPAGTPETNKARELQTEVEGFARDMAALSTYDLGWYLDEVLWPMADAAGDPGLLERFRQTYDQGQGIVLASEASPIRVKEGRAWYQTNELHAHQHAPRNSHWDAPYDLGFCSLRYIILTGKPDPTPDPEELTVADITAITAKLDAQAAQIEAISSQLASVQRTVGDWMQGERAWNGSALYRVKGKNAVHVMRFDDDGPFLVRLAPEVYALLGAGGDVDPIVIQVADPDQVAVLEAMRGFDPR